MDYSLISAAVVVALAACASVVLAALTLPGVWLGLLAAALVKWLWEPTLISPWTLIVCLVLAIAGEVIEMFASAAGTSKFGGSRSGAIASVAGGIAGAILGTFVIPIPIVGTVVGAIGGSALATFATELGYAKRTQKEAAIAAGGAAIGRTLATLTKLAIAGLVALVLIAAVMVDGM